MALKVPFFSRDDFNLQQAVCYYKYAPLPECYSVEIRDIVQKCLQKDPTRRPTIDLILAEPIIASRIKRFLTPEIFAREFPDQVEAEALEEDQ